MTVIAWDGTTLAADGLQVSGELVTSTKARKIRRAGDGFVGVAGEIALQKPIVDWIDAGMKWPSPAGDYAALYVPKSGPVILFNGGSLGPYSRPGFAYTAIGNGEDVAIGAMAVGVDAEEAVRAAIKHNVYCGGRVLAYRLRP